MSGAKDDYEVLFDERRLLMVTRLPPKALPDFARALQDAKIDRITRGFLQDYMKIAISAGGRGRKETIEAISASMQRRMSDPSSMMGLPGDLDEGEFDEPDDGFADDDDPLDKLRRRAGLGD